MTPHPGPADLPYLRTHFVPLDDLARAHGRDPAEVRAAIAAGRLPKPPYVLADGAELVAPDFFALTEAAGGDELLADWFADAYAAAAGGHPDADPLSDAWPDYLTGIYAVCLRSVSPATIVRKTLLVTEVERLLADAQPDDDGWLHALREAVDALDALEREFAQVDREIGPVSRDRLVAGPKRDFPQAWAEDAFTAAPSSRA